VKVFESLSIDLSVIVCSVRTLLTTVSRVTLEPAPQRPQGSFSKTGNYGSYWLYRKYGLHW